MNTALVRIALAAAIFLGFLTRAATFQTPLFDFHAWRQADTATIARNFVRDRFNPLAPEIDARGSRKDGSVETGLELMAVLAALAGRVVGFSAHLGRLISALSFPLAALLLYRFARDRYGEAVGLVVAWIYAFGLPLSLFMDRAFMNESLLALLSIISLRAAQRYLAGRRIALVGLLAATTVAGLVKPPYLVIWGAIAGMFVERHGRRAFVRWEIWAGLALNLLAIGLWFQHAHAIFDQNGLTFGLSNKMFNVQTLMTSHYYQLIYSQLSRDLLGPVVLVAALYGTVLAFADRRWAELGGLAGYAVHLAVVTEGNLNHNYYKLPIVPIAAVLAGMGIVQWVTRTGERRRWTDARRLSVTAGILALSLFATFVRSVSFHNWYEIDRSRLRLCEDLRPMLRPDDLIAFVGDLSPDVLYCLDRRGWLFSEITPRNQLRDLVADGADIVVAPRQYEGLLEVFADVPREPLVDAPGYVAFRLRP